MHILDDLEGLSARARTLLERTGRRETPPYPPLPIEFLRLRGRDGRPVPVPMMLAIRREGFEQRYGGLRYAVRRSFAIESERHVAARDWQYDVGDLLWRDPARGWYFDWSGERVSSPVRYLVHTDGRVGVEDGGGVFLEIAPSVPALIEAHALIDMVADWDPIARPRSTDPEVGAFALAQRLDGLAEVPEASGRTVRWRVSDTVAVNEFQNWASEEPRRWRAFIWTCGEAGRRQVEQAAGPRGARARTALGGKP